jgi:hypothetical protein
VPVPDPVPDADSVTHAAVVDDVHSQPSCVVTLIVPDPPPGNAVTTRGMTVNVQDALGWVTTKLLPAMVSVAVLDALVELAAAVKRTMPNPLPVAPSVIVTHGAPLDDVQLQVVAVLTVTVLVPPLAVIDRLVGVMLKEQVPAASCVTVNGWPATVSVPVRVAPGFDATV